VVSQKQFPQVQFIRFAPTIPVTDMDRAVRFYSDVLGMTKTFENGTPAGFVILERDGGELHLTLSKTHKASERNIAHLLVTDAKALYAQLEASGVRIIKGLRDADYEMRGFVFADLDGNRIDVGQML
jgi:catechol 2,3-dioxygenase-like lactoylglutathione lyase family enzyme